MQNWTVELTGTNHTDVQNTKEHKQKRMLHPRLLRTTVTIKFPVLEPIKGWLPKAQWMCQECKADMKSVSILHAPLLEAG